MDITINELKTMKAKELRRLVQEAIKEVLNEDAAADKAAIDAEKLAVDRKVLALQKKKQELAKDTSTLAENDIDEMARLAKGFKLADPNIDSAQFATKRVSGVPLSDIIDYIRENPGVEKAALQSQFNFVRPQIANALVNGLLDAGVLTKLSASGEEEAPVAPGETAPVQATEPEDLFMGSGENPLSMYFDNEPNNDGSEDFNDEEEPSAEEIEPQEPQYRNSSAMSDEDYDAFDKYSTLKQRLDATKSNILKMKRSKGSAGDIADKPGTELQRLRDFKKSLEDRLDTLIQSSSYLQKRLGIEPTAPELEVPETEEEPLDEWTINKMQYYAGIRK
jgi:hypothetical protein